MIDDANIGEIGWMLAPLRRAPGAEAPLDTEALRGEAVALGAEDEGWVEARLLGDGYEGWLPAAAIVPLGAPRNYQVAVPRTIAFPAPDIKQPPISALTLGARLRVVRVEGRFSVSEHGEFLIMSHLAEAEARAGDFVSVAEGLVGTPYLWGGKSALGIDCSGLVQLSLAAAGIEAPRDSGPQERGLGVAIEERDPARFRRGDLLFWPGHVAIARGDGTILHANAHHMLVAIEPAAEAIARIKAKGDELRTVKRLARAQ